MSFDPTAPNEYERGLAYALLCSKDARREYSEGPWDVKHVGQKPLRDLLRIVMDLHDDGLEVTHPDLMARGGNPTLIAELYALRAEAGPDAYPVSHHAPIVHEGAIGRAVREAGAIASAQMAGGEKPSRVADELMDLVGAIQLRTAVVDDAADMQEATERFIDDVTGQSTPALSSRWKNVNKALNGGLRPKKFYIVAARPGMGKTALAVQWAADYWRKSMRAPFFSFEMPADEIAGRIIQDETGLSFQADLDHPYNEVQHFSGSSEHRRKLQRAATELVASSHRVFVGGDRTIERVVAKCRKLARTGGIDAVFIDYLQLMDVARPSGNKAIDVGEISKKLKALAMDLDIPVVALSQLNRDLEKRPNRRPILSDLRDSGSLEQDADAVMFLYREEYYLELAGAAVPDDKVGLTEAIVAKHRGGWTGTTLLDFCRPLTRFTDRQSVDRRAA